MSRLLAILGLIAIAASGCGAQSSQAPTASRTVVSPTITAPASSTTATAVQVSIGTGASPSEAPSASAGVSALPDSGGHVLPGTYTTHFRPELTLTVGREVQLSCAPGFRCQGDVDVNAPSWLGLEFGNDPAFGVGINRVDQVVDLKHPGRTIDPPHDLAAWIASVPGLTIVSPPRSVTLGGVEGRQLDVRSGAKDVILGPIPGVDDPPFGLSRHSWVRITVVIVHGHQVVVAVGIETDSADGFESAVAALQPLLDSITWH